MPVALSTSKRKFHKILDSISNASNVSLISGNEKHHASTTTLPACNDPPAKKPRVARPVSAYAPATTYAAITSKAERRPLSVVQQPSSTGMNGDTKLPNFAPWDRGQFLERLKSYRHVDKWRGKPEKINEVQWSKRGWSCVGKERVCCVGGCSKEVVITLESSRENGATKCSKSEDPEDSDVDDDDWREKAYAQLVERYSEMITSAHDGGCLWRRRGCDDTIQRLPLAHQDNAIDGLRQRYKSLEAMSSELPSNPSTPDSLVLSDVYGHLSSLLPTPCENTKAQPEAKSPGSSKHLEALPALNTSAAVLALFGWQAEEGHISGLATCSACFRRLGLWLFRPSSDSTTPSSMDRLDVVGEHRDYCPWINPLSQHGAASRRTSLEGLAGWQVLLRAVQASVMHKKHESEKSSETTPPQTSDHVTSQVGTPLSLTTTIQEDRQGQDERDKERWAKLRRLKQVFQVKRNKQKSQRVV